MLSAKQGGPTLSSSNVADHIAAAAASSGTMGKSLVAKVVAHVRGFGFVLLYTDGQQHYITGERLISVSTQVKPVVLKPVALSSDNSSIVLGRLISDIPSIFDEAFDRRVVLSNADSHDSNVAAEQADAQGQAAQGQEAASRVAAQHSPRRHLRKQVHGLDAGHCVWHGERGLVDLRARS